LDFDIELSICDDQDVEGELLVVPVFQDEEKDPVLADLPSFPHRPLKGFEAKKGETRLVYEGGFEAEGLMLLGAGRQDELELADLTELGGSVYKEADKINAESCVFSFPMQLSLNREKIAREIVVGLKLAAYKFEKYKKKDEEKKENEKIIKKITIVIDDARSRPTVTRGLEKGKKIAGAVALGRDLGNTPGNKLIPDDLARKASEIADDYKELSLRIWDEEKLKSDGMDLITAVGSGSANPPRLIELTYEPKKSKGTVGLVGKGITFDSGGISIKPGKKMGEMKYDMSGAGTVLAVVKAVCELELPLKIIALVPTAENMPGGNSTRPGDIVTGYFGKSVEILNTDAEGRLILADALGYLSKEYGEELDVAFDYATLTGACVVALGHQAAAVLSTDDELAEELETAGAEIAERVWQMPLWEEYSEKLKSEIADVKNIGGRAGTITAACFLKEFVDTDKIKSWAHLDIAGVAWEMEELSYRPKAASGYGIRLTLEFFQNHFNL